MYASGGSLKSIDKAFKSGHIGKIFSPSANRSSASQLIHKGIPVAVGSLGGTAGTAVGALGGPVGGLAGGVAGTVAGHMLGDDIAGYVGKKTGLGLYASGGSLKSIDKAFKSGNVGKLFSKSANHSTASQLIHKGIPTAVGMLGGTAGTAVGALGGPVGGLAGGVAGTVAGHMLGDDIAGIVGKKTGYGIKKRRTKTQIAEAQPPYTDTEDGAVMEGEGLIFKTKKGGSGAWIAHVKGYAKQHGISYKQALKEAKDSYHGGKKSPESRYTAEIQHRINARVAEKKETDKMKPNFSVGLRAKRHDPRDYDNDDAEEDAIAQRILNHGSGRGLRWGTPKHSMFHRKKEMAFGQHVKDLEEMGFKGTTEHRQAHRKWMRRKAIADAADEATMHPDKQYQFKEYIPKVKDVGNRRESKWVSHVKNFAKDKGISYKEALQHGDAREAYKRGDYHQGYAEEEPVASIPEKVKRTRKPKAEVVSSYNLRPKKGRGVSSLPFV